MKKIIKTTALTLALTVALMSMCFVQFTFAEDENQIIVMSEESYMEDEPITFTVNYPEGQEPSQADWLGIYAADVDESNVYDGAGLGIWCYVWSGTRDYGTPESRTAEMEISDVNSTSGNWPLTPGEYKVLLFYNDSFTVAASRKFTIYEYTAPSAEPTEEPTPTAELTPTAEPTADPTDAPEGESSSSGCGSFVTETAVSAFTVIGAAALILKKKKANK